VIKYFHELTAEEYKELVDSKEYTYEKLAKDYPQPEWCNYPEATQGVMGCWSLMNHMVKGREYCINCECCVDYVEPNKQPKIHS
jgi:hypothetical protein